MYIEIYYNIYKQLTLKQYEWQEWGFVDTGRNASRHSINRSVILPSTDLQFSINYILSAYSGAVFFDRMPFLTSTTCVGCNMCYVFNVNVTDSFDDRRSQCRLI